MTKRNEPLVVCDAANRFTHHGGHPKLATCVNPRPVEASAPAAPPKVNELLDFLEAEAEKWAERVQLPAMASRITGNSEAILALLKESWIEGAYHGARHAAAEAELRDFRARREALEWACEATCGYCNPKNMLNLVGRFNDTNDHVGPEGEPYSCKAKNIHVELARIAAREKELEGRQ